MHACMMCVGGCVREQLRRNAASQQVGPGLPTSIAVHSKFITIGTSRSFVIVFDHFQARSGCGCGGLHTLIWLSSFPFPSPA